MTATGLIGSIAGLGLNASGVRQIAEAVGTNDETRIAHDHHPAPRLADFRVSWHDVGAGVGPGI